MWNSPLQPPPPPGFYPHLSFPPCSEFVSQSHFLLLLLFLAGQIRDAGVISGTFEVPINSGAARPALKPSASSSDQRLASRRGRPWNQARYWIPKAVQASWRPLSGSPPPPSDARSEGFHTKPIERFVLPGTSRTSEPTFGSADCRGRGRGPAGAGPGGGGAWLGRGLRPVQSELALHTRAGGSSS